MNEKKQLLENHGFTSGGSTSTKDWYIKRNQEVRLMGNGFRHFKIKGGRYVEFPHAVATLEDLEIFIYKNYLNDENVPRLFAPIIVITIPTKRTLKRRAKRVDLLLKIA